MSTFHENRVLSNVRTGVAGTVFAIVALLSTSTLEAQLKIDIGQAVGGTVTPESGFDGFTANVATPVANAYSASFGTGGGGTASVMITSPFYRSTPSVSYTQVTGVPGFNDLLSGSALINSTAQSIVLTLDDLADGEYSITTYHHSNYSPNVGNGAFDVYLYGVQSPLTSQAHSNVPTSVGSVSPSFTTRTTTFSVANGSATQLTFDGIGGTDGNNHASLTAFELTQTSTAGPGLLVDFGSAANNGGGPGGTQDGYVAFESDGGGSTTQAVTSTLGIGGMVDVTVSGQLVYRDYAAATGIFADSSALLSDGPLLNDAGTLSLLLEDLADGTYTFTGYLHTTENGPSARSPATPFDVLLTDGLLTDELVGDDLVMSDNSSSELSTVEFIFDVVAGSPVLIEFERGAGVGTGTDANDHFALAGFQVSEFIAPVPEPSSAILCLVLGLLGVSRRRSNRSVR